jgi:hypothetical protein
MNRLHVTQDDDGFWQLTLEKDDGTLKPLAHQFLEPDHLVQTARELVQEGRYPDAVIVVDPPRRPPPQSVDEWPDDYAPPAARKAGE